MVVEVPRHEAPGGALAVLRTRWYRQRKQDNGILSAAIREDGNDGAHQGTLTKEDAEDLLDFAKALLERVFTEPEKIKLAEKRREQRRAPAREK